MSPRRAKDVLISTLCEMLILAILFHLILNSPALAQTNLGSYLPSKTEIASVFPDLRLDNKGCKNAQPYNPISYSPLNYNLNTAAQLKYDLYDDRRSGNCGIGYFDITIHEADDNYSLENMKNTDRETISKGPTYYSDTGDLETEVNAIDIGELAYSRKLWERNGDLWEHRIVFIKGRIRVDIGMSSEWITGENKYNIKPYCDSFTQLAASIAVKLPASSQTIPYSPLPTKLTLKVEENPDTHQPYRGVVADGNSSLKIDLLVSQPKNRYVGINVPALGRVKGKTIQNGNIVIDAEGKATVTYYPPDYLVRDQLTEKIKIPKRATDLPWGTYAWGAVVPLLFNYMDSQGQMAEEKVEIRVYRPPVMLVHGIFGDKDTWAILDPYLREDKFDTSIREYYSPENAPSYQSIESQATKLQSDIRDKKYNYTESDIKIEKVDLIGHSMGGLIARYFVLPRNKLFNHDVRKLIMVATPNHGASVNWARVAWWGSQLMQKHQAAANELSFDSQFFDSETGINAGEWAGNHLNLDVEYGNIYCFYNRNIDEINKDRVIQSGPENDVLDPFSDGVVNGASAHLNGVAELPMQGVTHSLSITSDLGTPITVSPEMMDKAKEWLTHAIPRPELEGLSAKAFAIRDANAYIRKKGGSPIKVTPDPITIDQSDELITGDSIVQIDLSLQEGKNGFINNWGKILVFPESDMAIGYMSPSLTQVKIKKGKAYFTKYKDIYMLSSYSVEIVPTGGDWVNPTARIHDKNTAFTVSADDNGGILEVYSINGTISVAKHFSSGVVFHREINGGQGLAIFKNETIQDLSIPPDPWWSEFHKNAETYATGSFTQNYSLSSQNTSGQDQTLTIIQSKLINLVA